MDTLGNVDDFVNSLEPWLREAYLTHMYDRRTLMVLISIIGTLALPASFQYREPLLSFIGNV